MSTKAFPNAKDHDGVEKSFETELVRNATIELTSGSVDQLVEVSDLLPRGTKVFIPDIADQSVGQKTETVAQIHNMGFDPVPHLIPDRWSSSATLKAFLEHCCTNHGVHRVHLLGALPGTGEATERTTELIGQGLLAEAGIRAVTLRGYPEGKPGVDQEAIAADLQHRLELARKQGLGIDILTHFCFVPTRTLEYCSRLERFAPEINQYISIAGPASAEALEHYAQVHRISPALRGLDRFGAKAVTENFHTSADEQLQVFARHCALLGPGNIIGVHLLSPGGFQDTARWLHQHLS